MLEYICFQIATESQNSHSSLNSLSLQSCHTKLNFKKKILPPSGNRAGTRASIGKFPK